MIARRVSLVDFSGPKSLFDSVQVVNLIVSDSLVVDNNTHLAITPEGGGTILIVSMLAED